jgi:dTDP-4-amino-4,6-dideoxygalactose transaminase
VYLERAFEGLGVRPSEALVNAKQLGETSLMFLVHPTLTEKNINKLIEVLTDVSRVAAN